MSSGTSNKVGRWLDGFLATRRPRKELSGLPSAADQERLLILRVVLRGAPEQGLEDWLDDLQVELATRCFGAFWPTPDIARAALAALNERRPSSEQNASGHEAAIFGRMEQFFLRTGAELPGFGRPNRTAELIRKGVLESEREAKFWGFTLSADQTSMAKTQRPVRAEIEHHARWLARHHGWAWHAAMLTAKADFGLDRDQSDSEEVASDAGRPAA